MDILKGRNIMEKKFKNDNYFSNGWKSDEWSSDGWSSDGWFSDEKSELSFDDLEGIAGGVGISVGGFQQETILPSIKDKIVSGPTGGCQDSNTGEENGEKNKSGFILDGIIR